MFRWFIDRPLDEAVFDASSFSQNQERLLRYEVADLFSCVVVQLAKKHGWGSNKHFSVDSVLIEAWVSIKRFKPKESPKEPGPGNTWTDFKGQKRKNNTHASTTDLGAKLVRKGNGRELPLRFAGHATIENRNGLCVLFEVTRAVGEPEAQVAVFHAIELKNRGFTAKSIGSDKGYHSRAFVTGWRERGIAPHPAPRDGENALRVRCGKSYTVSRRVPKTIEEIFD
jgi:hypothetical protein